LNNKLGDNVLIVPVMSREEFSFKSYAGAVETVAIGANVAV